MQTDCNKYYNDEEDKIRFELFKKTVKKVVNHNKKCKTNQVCYPLRINRFADRKPEELQPAQPGKSQSRNYFGDFNIHRSRKIMQTILPTTLFNQKF